MKSFAKLFGCCLLLLGAACGVRGYPHDILHPASNNDFLPSGPADNNVDTPKVHVVPDEQAVDASAAEPSATDAPAPMDASPAAEHPAADAAAPMTDAAQALDAGATGKPSDAGLAADSGDGDEDAPHDATNTPAVAGDIVLGSAHLRKEDVLAFIHFGHSNMAGLATDPVELRNYNFAEAHPRAWRYRVGMPPDLAVEPTARQGHDAYAGPGTSLVKQAAERSPKKYFVSLGYGVGGAYCAQFLPGGLYFDPMMQAALAIKERVTFVGIVVMLGNTELRVSEAERAKFPECINTLVTAVRQALGQPDLPLLISGYEMEATDIYAVNGDFANQMIPQFARLPSVVSNSAVVPADGLQMQDDHHFNLSGHKVWTGRLLDIMQAKGWAPWMGN